MGVYSASRRGGPLVTFAVLGAAWVGARLLLWENPLPLPQLGFADVATLAARGAVNDGESGFVDENANESLAVFGTAAATHGRAPSQGGFVRVPIRKDVIRVALGPRNQSYEPEAVWATAPRDYVARSSMGHTMLWRAAMRQSGRGRLEDAAFRTAAFARSQGRGASPTGPVTPDIAGRNDRWSLNAWGFFRQGSGAAPISQGRVPTYGASQVGAKLAYRIAPSSRHDPRLFVRAYRALIENGESEVATGASARLLAKLPLRLAGEVRFTDTPGGARFRPAAYAFTEIPPISLPARFSLEAYAQGGYVGGTGATPFADGQATITRPLTDFSVGSLGNARLSFGSGIWGGAQEGASRVDIGPTMRLDMSIGKTPARISVDVRQKVAGDAAPESGVAATVSTRF